MCDAFFTTILVLLFLIYQVLFRIQSAIFENIIHMLKFNTQQYGYLHPQKELVLKPFSWQNITAYALRDSFQTSNSLVTLQSTFSFLLNSFNFKVICILQWESPLPLECLPGDLYQITCDTIFGELSLKGDFNDDFPERS